MSSLVDKIDKISFDKRKLKKVIKNDEIKVKFVERFYYDYYSEINLPKFKEVVRIKDLRVSDIPTKDNALFCLTTKNINSTEIFEIINSKYKIIEISSSFATINNAAVENFKKYKVNKIFRRDYKNERYDKLVNKINVNEKKSLNLHTKNFLIKCENENYFTIVTSANPNISDNMESYLIENSKKNYDNLLKFFNQDKNTIKLRVPEQNYKYGFFDIRGEAPIDLLKEIIKNEKIIELDLIIYGSGKKHIIDLQNLVEKKDIEKLNIFASGYLKRVQKSSLYLLQNISNKIKFGNHHSKMMLVRTKQNYYFINSTSNLNSKSKIEHTEIVNSQKYYNFIKNFIHKFFK